MPGNIPSSHQKTSFDENNKPAIKEGLVVTISREKGCGAYSLSRMIIEKLNELKYPQGELIQWKLISREILELSAERLKLAPSKVDAMIDMHVFERIRLAFSQKSFPNDTKIKNTIRDVIQSAADRGNMIIIGRGGVGITRNAKNSLHIKLIAPFDWRVEKIAAQENISIEKATPIVKERDRQREILKQYYLGEMKNDIHLFDLIINVNTLEKPEVADAIFRVIKLRQDELML